MTSTLGGRELQDAFRNISRSSTDPARSCCSRRSNIAFAALVATVASIGVRGELSHTENITPAGWLTRLASDMNLRAKSWSVAGCIEGQRRLLLCSRVLQPCLIALHKHVCSVAEGGGTRAAS